MYRDIRSENDAIETDNVNQWAEGNIWSTIVQLAESA